MMSKRTGEVYQDKAGEWRWRVVAGNGEIVAEGESYTRLDDAARGLNDADIEFDEYVAPEAGD